MPVARITDIQSRRAFITQTNYFKSKPKTIGSFTAEAKGIYPFRVRFENIGVYSSYVVFYWFSFIFYFWWFNWYYLS